jgi:outer membrane protein
VRILLTFIYCIFFAQNLQATSINEAIESLYDNNNQLKMEKFRIKDGKAVVVGAILGMVPDVRGTFGIQSNQALHITGRSTISQDLNPSKVIQISQQFSTGSVLLGPKSAIKNLELQKLTYRSNEQNIILTGVSAYMNVIRSKMILRAAEENEKILSRYTELVKKRFDLGEVTRTDVEQSKSRLYIAQSNRIQAEGGLKAANASYKKIFGIDPYNLSMPNNFDFLPKSFNDFKKRAHCGNLDIKISNLNKILSKYSLANAMDNIMPSVVVSGMIDQNPNPNYYPNIDKITSFSVDLKVPIVPNGGAEYANIARRKYAFNIASYQYEDDKLDLEKNIADYWNNFKTTSSNVKANETAVEYTVLVVNAITKEAEFGGRTILDVLNARLDNFNAQVNLTNALYDQILSYYNLIAIMGQLDKKIFTEKKDCK